MFLLMLLKYSEKSADVSLWPPWAACKSLFLSAQSDPETDRKEPSHDSPITDVKRRDEGPALFPICFSFLHMLVKLILGRNVSALTGCVLSMACSVITLQYLWLPPHSNRNKTRQTCTSPIYHCRWMSRSWRTC